MYLRSVFLVINLFLSGSALFAQEENDVLAYIERHKNLAIAEQTRVGVPAAITLAQGIHESAAGKSELALIGNNHFGIKCKSTWTGETMLHDDDKKQECFRKYMNTEQSYIDHSDFLRASNRYHFLFDMEITDYTGWASGLKRAGYATNPSYVKRLTDLVEKYNLQQYTYEAIALSPVKPGEIVPEKDEVKSLTHVDDPSTFYKGLPGFWANKGSSLLPKALEKNIRYAKLLSMNDLADEPLTEDMFVFTDKKRKVGTEEFHVVKEGESMLMISQKEAIMLSMLYTYNNMIPGQEAEVGERLCLLYRIYGKPKLKQQFLNELKREETETQTFVNRPAEKVVAVETVQPIKEEIKSEPAQKEVLSEPLQKEIVSEPVAIKQTTTEILNQQPASVSETKAEVTMPIEALQQPAKNELEQRQQILDEEKARRMEALLNSKPLNEAQKQVVNEAEKIQTPAQQVEPTQPVNLEAQKTNQVTPAAEPKVVEEEAKAVVQEPVQEVKTIPIVQEAVVQKRTYDEVGIDDSVKSLKRKFDRIVYSPRAAKKVDTPIVKQIDVKAPPLPIKKEQAPVVKKEDEKKVEKLVPKKNNAVKKADIEVKKDDKKSNVQLTKTGIKRDADKINAKKKEEENLKKAKDKKLSAKDKLEAKKDKKTKKIEVDAKEKTEKAKKNGVSEKSKNSKKKSVEKETTDKKVNANGKTKESVKKKK